MKQNQPQKDIFNEIDQIALNEQDPLYHQPIELRKFMRLCDLHHSIIQQYKVSQSCSIKASVCKKGCPNAQKQHKFTNNNHQSISAKQFYSQFHTLRQSYFNILTTLRDKTIPEFMARIRLQLQELQNTIKEEINSNGLELVQKLCRVSHKNITKLLELVQQPKTQQIELSQLTCKDVYLFKQLAKILPKYLQKMNQDKKNNLNNDFVQSYFLKMLKSKGYLNALMNDKKQTLNQYERDNLNENIQNKNQIPVVIDIQDIKQIPGELIRILTKDEQQQNDKESTIKKKIQQIQTLNLKIRSQMKDLIQNYGNSSGINRLSEQNSQLQLSFNCLEAYLLKVKPSKVYLSLNIDLDNNIVIDNLVNIFNKSKSITNLIVYTTKDNKANNDNISYLQKQISLYNDTLKPTIQYNIQWCQNHIQNQNYLKTQLTQNKDLNLNERQKQKLSKKNTIQQYQYLMKILK